MEDETLLTDNLDNLDNISSESTGVFDRDDEEEFLEELSDDARQLVSEQIRVNSILYPSKKHRIQQLPLFYLASPEKSQEGTTPTDKEKDWFEVHPMGEEPRKWLDVEYALKKRREWRDQFTFRVGLILYIAGGQDTWAGMVRKAMRAYANDSATAEQNIFLGIMARLEPYPTLWDSQDVQENEGSLKLTSASLFHIASELEKMGMSEVFSACLPSAKDVDEKKIQRFSRFLASRIRGTLAKTTKDQTSKRYTLNQSKLNFRFLLPCGTLTESTMWFGWEGLWNEKLHPMIVNTVESNVLKEMQKKNGKYSRSEFKESLLNRMVAFATVDKKKLGDNELKKGKGLAKLGIQFCE